MTRDRPECYTLRIPVRTLGEMPITGLDSGATLEIEGLKVSLRASPSWLIVIVEGFENEDAASAFIPRVIVGLWGLVVRWNIAFRANFDPQPIFYAEDPVAAGNNLAHTFGQESGPPIDGIVYAADTLIYPSVKRLRWIGIGDARGIVQTPSSLAFPIFAQAASTANADELVRDEKFKTAVELFNACFYETSLRAKFL